MSIPNPMNTNKLSSLLLSGVAGTSLVGLLASTGCSSSKNRQAEMPSAPSVQEAPAITQRNSSAIIEPEIRVAIQKDQPEIRLTAGNAGAAVLAPDGRELTRFGPGQEVVFFTQAGGVYLKNGPVNSNPGGGALLTLQALNESSPCALNGTGVCAKIRVVANPQTRLINAVALIPLEEYLSGVLAGEVPFERWNFETLKAQAIASRSYALSQMKAKQTDIFDVESTVQSQVFKAGYRDNPKLKSIIDATRGQIVTFQGKIFPTYFCSNSGGQTAPVATIFKDQAPIPPLAGVASPFSAEGPNFQWQAHLERMTMLGKLNAAPEFSGKPLSQINALEFLPSAGQPAGTRAENVRISYPGGFTVLPANRFRIIVGAGELKSVWIESIRDTGSGFDFSGRGFGHGVGLCQWGASAMGNRGYSAEQILGFYYPGAELTKLYSERVVAQR